ncbi:MAG TPA: universal stress protein [Acidobacteriota bacterium]|nr:universal stress protein [Acidobacteriota bacterium]
MLKFNKILCPVDFSETSIKALQWAEFLAKRFNSELTVLHTIEIPLTSDPYIYDTENAQTQAEKSLETLLAPLTVKHNHLISFGDASPNIKKIADEIEAKLIIMGTRGLKGFRHKFIGSTAEYVMRHASIPVITISPVCGPPHPNLNRALVLVSDVETIPEGELMKAVADELDIHVTLMHVVSFAEPMYKVKSELLPFNTMALETEVTRKKLTKLGTTVFGEGKIYGSAVGFGDITAEILRESNTQMYDFILMSAHSETSHLPFAESKGYNILCDSRIPVITVRRQ